MVFGACLSRLTCEAIRYAIRQDGKACTQMAHNRELGQGGPIDEVQESIEDRLVLLIHGCRAHRSPVFQGKIEDVIGCTCNCQHAAVAAHEVQLLLLGFDGKLLQHG